MSKNPYIDRSWMTPRDQVWLVRRWLHSRFTVEGRRNRARSKSTSAIMKSLVRRSTREALESPRGGPIFGARPHDTFEYAINQSTRTSNEGHSRFAVTHNNRLYVFDMIEIPTND